MSRTGVFICHCGTNIASALEIPRLIAETKKLPQVAFVQDYPFLCSSPGQALIKEKIKEHTLNRVVVAGCTPGMHLPTFQHVLLEAGLNPYLISIANIREQCSWVTKDKQKATEKAINLIRRQVRRIAYQDPLFELHVPIEKTALVIGGGIAGIQAALDIASSGNKVILVEKSPGIGGRMLQLDETFPTLDCSQCILTPRMVEVRQDPNIELRVNSTVKQVNGFIGNFDVVIEKKATYVDEKACIGCGICQEKCPVKKTIDEFNAGLSKKPAISLPSPHAVPAIPVIDPEHCMRLTSGTCGVCEKICPTSAIRFDDKASKELVKAGAIVVATGFNVMDPAVYTEYGAGTYPDVITGLQFERLISSTGPTNGKLARPSDQTIPKQIVFIQCAGSRDKAKGHPYCSGICCMYTAKHAMLYKHRVPDGHAYVLYIDIRSPGKGYDEFVRRAIEEYDVHYLRGGAAKIIPIKNKYRVFAEDTLAGRPVTIDADMVVLASVVEPQEDAAGLAQILGISYDLDNFYTEAHPKLRPIETTTAGIFLAGAVQGPKDIPSSVLQGSAAAAKIISLFSKKTLTKSPQVASIHPSLCIGCMACVSVCNYSAIADADSDGNAGGKRHVEIIQVKCQGCGVCVAVCKGKAITLAGYSDDEMYEEIAL